MHTPPARMQVSCKVVLGPLASGRRASKRSQLRIASGVSMAKLVNNLSASQSRRRAEKCFAHRERRLEVRPGAQGHRRARRTVRRPVAWSRPRAAAGMRVANHGSLGEPTRQSAPPAGIECGSRGAREAFLDSAVDAEAGWHWTPIRCVTDWFERRPETRPRSHGMSPVACRSSSRRQTTKTAASRGDDGVKLSQSRARRGAGGRCDGSLR
ncbi:hypothetical protein P171DRAFT_90589 [Karstenula rhodostoma CBS 690.94]|uniref:Uncharacterized protein n=1 Tax=Karstenula rhodostoma CBS 690.94 TaxID=1392251 RepID=A0A9P4PDU6_9PLEO|nr:hypothetical protein P171DRAFT_90589 [Karstenula rhodostoma CBS 690.94]